MLNIILFDDQDRDQLLPLTFTRPCAELRIGILTVKEKWSLYLKGEASYITEEYLGDKYSLKYGSNNIVINGLVLPSPELGILVSQLDNNEALMHNGALIAAKLDEKQFTNLMNDEEIEELVGMELWETPFIKIKNLGDIVKYNAQEIVADYELLTKNHTSKPISATNTIINPANIFLEDGVKMEACILNATDGPIFLAKDSIVLEGSMIKGPFGLGEGSVVKMGTRIYQGTSTGPNCKLGGEIKNSVFFANSNKGHDGYLGDSVIGEWCNLGAGTNTSNLKNNYDEVRLWSYLSKKFDKTGMQFLGLIMGDHSKCGINTMFNTGTVVGVFANIFGSGFPRNFVPSFSWGGHHGFMNYKFSKAIDTAKRVLARKGIELDENDIKILENIKKQTVEFRPWEK